MVTRNMTVAVFKALAHPLRIKVVDMLVSGEKCVCEIFPALGVSQPNASQHLNILRAAGVVDSYRDGTRVYYRLTSPEFTALVEQCRRITGELGKMAREQARTLAFSMESAGG